MNSIKPKVSPKRGKNHRRLTVHGERSIINPDQQPELISEPRAEYNVTPEQQAEKEAYRERLRLKLKDPTFRQIEGFPLGEDEAILALSDPPYYTACPNPFLGEIIENWQQERSDLRKELGLPDDSQDNGIGVKVYQREPFAADVPKARTTRSTMPILTTPKYHTKPSCATSCTTPTPAISSWTASAVLA